MPEISTIKSIVMAQAEYVKFQKLIYDQTGISMKENKKSLVESRLNHRLRSRDLENFSAYYEVLLHDSHELQVMIDKVTTNETSFFRENRHFEYIQQRILPQVHTPLRVWSAAASIGVEAYTIAMVIDEVLSGRGVSFEVLASDINVDVLKKAKAALYPLSLAEKIPQNYLKHYCRKGVNDHEGSFTIKETLKQKVRFSQINLMRLEHLEIGRFDMIFLRNVLIYFDIKTKRAVVNAILEYLKPGGYFFIGHSESLFDINDSLTQIMPTVYQKA